MSRSERSQVDVIRYLLEYTNHGVELVVMVEYAVANRSILIFEVLLACGAVRISLTTTLW